VEKEDIENFNNTKDHLQHAAYVSVVSVDVSTAACSPSCVLSGERPSSRSAAGPRDSDV